MPNFRRPGSFWYEFVKLVKFSLVIIRFCTKSKPRKSSVLEVQRAREERNGGFWGGKVYGNFRATSSVAYKPGNHGNQRVVQLKALSTTEITRNLEFTHRSLIITMLPFYNTVLDSLFETDTIYLPGWWSQQDCDHQARQVFVDEVLDRREGLPGIASMRIPAVSAVESSLFQFWLHGLSPNKIRITHRIDWSGTIERKPRAFECFGSLGYWD